jgi:hypothetical protein
VCFVGSRLGLSQCLQNTSAKIFQYFQMYSKIVLQQFVYIKTVSVLHAGQTVVIELIVCFPMRRHGPHRKENTPAICLLLFVYSLKQQLFSEQLFDNDNEIRI